jgi:hypothetical protein
MLFLQRETAGKLFSSFSFLKWYFVDETIGCAEACVSVGAEAGDVGGGAADDAPALLGVGVQSLFQNGGVKLAGVPLIFLGNDLVFVHGFLDGGSCVGAEIEVHTFTLDSSGALCTTGVAELGGIFQLSAAGRTIFHKYTSQNNSLSG